MIDQIILKKILKYIAVFLSGFITAVILFKFFNFGIWFNDLFWGFIK